MATKVPTILSKILKQKAKEQVNSELKREFPLTPPNLTSFPFIIAEIKRASPSAGNISEIKSPTKLAKSYLEGGASAISVLCERQYFKGDIQDLSDIKKVNQDISLLRKDFLTDISQILESYGIGADLVLLITAIFMNGENGGFQALQNLYHKALELGLTPLIEVHNLEEVAFVTPLKAKLLGVNSRNLHTFKIDKIAAFNLLESIKTNNPQSKVIFESSIENSFDGFVVGNVGFDGILCGSYLVRDSNPTLALKKLKDSIIQGAKTKPFYAYVFKLLANYYGFIKICGMTNIDNMLMCAQKLTQALEDKYPKNFEKIAALGFILVKKSKRFIPAKEVASLTNVLQEKFPKILRIGVVSDDEKEMQDALMLFKNGNLDAIQLHGSIGETFAKQNLKEAYFSFYQAQNISQISDLRSAISPFVLLDSKSLLGGGSGESIPYETLNKLKERLDYLCVAGGIGTNNLKSLLKCGAKMLDINSSLESKIGIKDENKLQDFLQAFCDYKQKGNLDSL